MISSKCGIYLFHFLSFSVAHCGARTSQVREELLIASFAALRPASVSLSSL